MKYCALYWISSDLVKVRKEGGGGDHKDFALKEVEEWDFWRWRFSGRSVCAVLHLENTSAKKCGRFNFIVLRGSDLNCFEKCGMNTWILAVHFACHLAFLGDCMLKPQSIFKCARGYHTFLQRRGFGMRDCIFYVAFVDRAMPVTCWILFRFPGFWITLDNGNELNNSEIREIQLKITVYFPRKMPSLIFVLSEIFEFMAAFFVSSHN